MKDNFTKALIYESQGLFLDASRIYEEILTNYPDDERAKLCLKRVLEKLKNPMLERFLSSDEKLETIKQNAIPYLALIYMPGHIMLYSGIINGEVSVIHNVWGLRTVDNGRALIGQTAITSLKIGQYNPNIIQSNLFLNKITKLILLD